MRRIIDFIRIYSRPARAFFRNMPIVRNVRRLRIVASYLLPPFVKGLKWALTTTEESNFYYQLTEKNEFELAFLISQVVSAPISEIEGYFKELKSDKNLESHIRFELENNYSLRPIGISYGRRIGWYAMVRASKPKLVVETGVDHGVGACVIAAALLRNQTEGFPGKYLGTEINEKAGALLSGSYGEAGKIIYQDSLKTLKELSEEISIFVNDSDHSSEYEANEYEAIKDKLSSNGLILGDNAHVTDKLASFALRTSRSYVFFKEQPLDHWYPGGGIGIAY